MEAVANTAATQIEGNQLAYLFEVYEKKGDIRSNDQDKVYELLRETLLEIKKQNRLSTEIYTLTYDKSIDAFYFGVCTNEKPLFREVYDHYPKKLLEQYTKGGEIDVYEDENGHWLSAFAPLVNSKGEVVGVVQVDSIFDEFLKEAKEEIFTNIGISLIVTLILLFFLAKSVRSILITEDRLTADLIQSKLELEHKNQETLDSILYAKKIQDAILPLHSTIKESLKESFILHRPRDIVSGDFYWFRHLRGKIFIASVDCTGHGVPGAFMSMIGSILLDDIIVTKQIDQPDIILNMLHKGVVKALRQSSKEKASKDGMDIALCVIDEKLNKLQFAGALRPLIHIREGELMRIKSDASPIGGYRAEMPVFSLHEIDIQKGDVFYIYSDGYPDQFGGELDKKYMTKRFRELLLSMAHRDMSVQKDLLEKEFNRWRGNNEQVDDVLVLGFRL